MTLLHMDAVGVRLGDKQILQNVSFNVDAGEIITVVGPNGSGKSTLLRTIIGSLKPSEGRVNFSGKPRIGYVPQKLHIDRNMPMSVSRFLSLPNKVSKANKNKAMETSGIMGLADAQLSDLSGGQFQRVLLARAILSEPTLLILDEANQGLDQPATAAFYKLISEVRDTLGCAVLMVSHDLHVVMAASDRVICLNGHVCCHGTPQTVADAPEYRAMFGFGTQGTLALYRHAHDHSHDTHDHGEGSTCNHE